MRAALMKRTLQLSFAIGFASVATLASGQDFGPQLIELQVDGLGQKEVSIELLDPESIIQLPVQVRDVFDLTLDEALRITAPNDTSNVIDFVELNRPLDRVLQEFRRLCDIAPSSDACQIKARLTALAPQFETGQQARAQCSDAANAVYDIWSNQPNTWHRSEEARQWDASCLARPLEGDVWEEAIGSTPSFKSGILTTVGILSVNKEVKCSGLLRPDGTFITAAHCQRGAPDKALSVKQISSNEVRTLSKIDAGMIASGPTDWAIYQVGGGTPLEVADTQLVDQELTGAGEETTLFPIGYSFPAAYREVLGDPRQAITDLAPALRAPRVGMCVYVMENAGCMHLACQTMGGFSGAPIFRRSQAEGPFQVVGILTGGKSTNSQCKGVALPRVTFGVPMKNFQYKLVGRN